MKLVYVHGRGQAGRDPDAIAQQWTDGLRRGLAAAGRDAGAALDTTFAFYGDELEEQRQHLATPTVDVVARGGESRDDSFTAFHAAIVLQMARRGAISTEAATAALAIADRGPLEWPWLQAVSAYIGQRIPWLAERTIEHFTEDVWAYLTRRTIQKAVDDIVLAAIPTEPCVVVSHSLGTVVAYNVLAHNPDLDVRLWVTLGSPLGLEAIRDKISRPLENPKCSRAWLNVTDVDDIVALVERLDRQTFGASADIENISDVDNGDDPHSVERYLADNLIARRIAAVLGIP